MSAVATALIAGAYSRMPPRQGRIVETFLVASWMEHLRQHERVTNADRAVEECVRKFQLDGEPTVTHLIAAEF